MKNPEEYQYQSAESPWLEAELWPALRSILDREAVEPCYAIELGCGNGATADMLSRLGYEVLGIDPSESGIRVGTASYPTPTLKVGSVYDDLASIYGRFPLVISLEVIEHCYLPAKFARTAYELLEDDGIAIVSTPFHGYWKNLVLSVWGRWDQHFDPLWDHGDIKFFSENTLRQLMQSQGLTVQSILRVGRVGPLAKSMFAVCTRNKDAL